jgi:uncharacterized membrane protein
VTAGPRRTGTRLTDTVVLGQEEARMLHAAVLALVLLLNGLAAGVLTASELGQFPLMARLPADRYVQTHAFFSTRYDPFMPVCLVVTTLGDLFLAVTSTRLVDRGLYGVAAVCVAVAILIALTRNVPINTWVRSVDPRNPPEDWKARRAAWGEWNRRRCILVVTALAAQCATIAVGR